MSSSILGRNMVVVAVAACVLSGIAASSAVAQDDPTPPPCPNASAPAPAVPNWPTC